MIALLIIACAIFGIGFVAVLIKLLLLKNDICQIREKLLDITQTDTNAKVTMATFDKDISCLSQSINKLLDKSRQDYFQVQRTEAALKRAITNISHDLRTPLTSAKGYLQMAKNSNVDEAVLSRYHTIICDRLDALTVLMDSLFAFSLAVEGDVNVRRVNMGNILRDILVNNFAEIEGKGFVVESNIPDTPIYCMCDEDALKRVLQNLLSNATQHGDSYLRVGLQDGVVEIANKTDATEIDTHNIFERFYTADTSRINKRTGLGLAIAKELVQKMGGSISATLDNNLFVMRVWLPKA